MIKSRHSERACVAAFGLACIFALDGCSASRFISNTQGNQFENAFGPQASADMYTPQLAEIERVSDGFLAKYQQHVDYPGNNVIPLAYKTERNEYISMKMFEIDQAYYKYLTWLDIGDTGVVSSADFAQLGLTTAATAIPVAQTTKILAAAATAVGGA